LEGERKNMNTVKRWLAGLLSFAMIFTSSAFTNVGAINVFAASGVEVTVTNGTVTHKTTFDSLEEVLIKYRATDLTERHENELIMVKLLGNETLSTSHRIAAQMIIDLNGFTVNYEKIKAGFGYCEGGLKDLRPDGYPKQIFIDEHAAEDEGEIIYNWVYDEDHTPDWYVKSISFYCPNCEENDVLPAKAVHGETEYDADEKVYKYTDNFTPVPEEWAPGDVEDDDWLLNGKPWISKIAGQTVKENDLPVVYVPIQKINNGEQQNVKAIVSAVTDSAEIKEIIKYQKGYNISKHGFVEPNRKYNGIVEGNTEATCLEAGAQIYKLTVNDPDGELVATIYIRDKYAIPEKPHVAGKLIGYQIANISDMTYGSEKAALRAAKAAGIDVLKTEKTEEGEWYYMYWPKDGAYERIDGTGNGNTTGEIKVESKNIRENGTFDYRFAYDCDNGNLEEHTAPVFDVEATTSEVYQNATTHAQAIDGQHSVCEYWVIKPVTKEYEYTKSGKKVKYTHTSTVNVTDNTDIGQYTNNAIRTNYCEKLASDIKHTPDTKSGYTESGYGTCKNSGYERLFYCSICHQYKSEYVKIDHEFKRSDISIDAYTTYISSKANIKFITGVEGDNRKPINKTDKNGYVDSITFDSDCTHEGGTYKYCEGVVYPSGYESPHWVLDGTPTPAKGHIYVAKPNTWEWQAWDPNGKNYEGDIVGTVNTKTTENDVFDGREEYDYAFKTQQSCNREGCNDYDSTVIYHSEDGIDGYDKDNVYHVYNAITIAKNAPGADCSSQGSTVFTVKGLTIDGTTPVTLTYGTGERGPHDYEVTGVRWSDDYEAAEIVGYCKVDGCVDKKAHPGYDSAIVSRSVDKDTGITTFTATYKGEVVGTKQAYSLKRAEVTFNPKDIEDANLVTGYPLYCAPVDEAAPAVKVAIDGVEIDSSLYNVDWTYRQSPVYSSGVASTARFVWVRIDWSDEILNQKDVDIIWDYDYYISDSYNAVAKKMFDVEDATTISNSKKEEISEVEALGLPYDPEISYSVVTDCGIEGATVKYKVLPEEIELTEAEKKELKVPEWVEVQRRIEALEYDLDEVKDIKDAGEYHVYAQITKDGYTTYSGEVAELSIKPMPVFADVDNVTVIEGTMPVFTLQARDINGEVVEIDPAEYTFATLGGGELTALTPGTYKIQIVSKNYDFRSDRYNDYVCVLNVIAMDDATAADQAKAKAIGDQIDALGDNPTEAEVAAARAAYDKLSDAAKARISPETLKKLTDAEAAIQAKKDANTAIAAAKGYESDAAVKAALDALNAALAKGDTAAIKTATTTLNNAIKAAKDAAAAKTAANNAITAANAYASDATIKALIDALKAALAKNDTAAIKKATADLNNAVAKKKSTPAPKPAPKKASKVKIKTKSKKIKASTIKKKAKKFKVKYSKTGNGKVTFKKVSGSKKLKISKAGKITIKKGTKKGTYKIKVKATIAATSTYKKATATKTIKVKVTK
jgi:hypothetical protein